MAQVQTNTTVDFDIGRLKEASKFTMFDYLYGAALQCFLKDKVSWWLVCKLHEAGRGPDNLDTQGQGVIHLAAGFSCEWASGPIIAAGINPQLL